MTKTKCNVNRVVAWYNAHGQNASKTARRFKVSRQTVHSYINKLKRNRKRGKK